MKSRCPSPRQGPGAAAVLAVVLLAAATLAGCLQGEPGADAPEDPDGPLRFGDGLGPGHVDPLIPLAGDATEDAAAILAACAPEADPVACANEHLKAVLGAAGSAYAFDVLEAMAAMDETVGRFDHPIAHVLGRHALHVYGTIGETLITCSHKVFQGCIHGALQEYFEHVGLDEADLDRICPEDATAFERYACMHGLGHGLVLATAYDLPRSLDHCAGLTHDPDRVNCYGGAFMENVVAHYDHIMAGGTFAGHGRDPQTGQDGHGHGDGGHHDHHAHGGSAVPDFWVDPDDPLFPCNAIDETYRPHCWKMQTSLILFLNSGDFHTTASLCVDLDNASRDNCFVSLGRDAASWAQRDPWTVSAHCSAAAAGDPRALCVRGAVSELVTNHADPHRGLPFCAAYPEEGRGDCYAGLGHIARSHLDRDGLEALCAEVEEGYRDECRIGASL